MRALEQETAVFESRRDEFERDHNLKWVVIHGDEIAGFFPDLQQAARVAIDRYGRGPYLIKQIGEPDPPIPLSLFARPMYV